MTIAIARSTKSRVDLGKTVNTITLDGSYSAGGYAVTPAQLGLVDTPDSVSLTYVHATATNNFVPVYDFVNNKIKIFKSGTAGATLNECVSGDITSSHSIVIEAVGRPIL